MSVQEVLGSGLNLNHTNRFQTILYAGFEAYSLNQQIVSGSRKRMAILNLKKRIRSLISNDYIFWFKMKFSFFINQERRWFNLREIPKQLKLRELSVDFTDLHKISKHIIKSI